MDLHNRITAMASSGARMMGAAVVAIVSFSSVVMVASAQSEPIVRSQSGNPACAPQRTVQGAHVVVAFKSTTTCDWSIPAGVTMIDYVVVAGGGGGASRAGGGGGAGGMLTATSRSVSGVAQLTIAVGAGGAGGPSGQFVGVNGSASSITGTGFVAVTTVGGGGGGTAIAVGRNGGSGGGASGAAPNGSSNTPGTGTSGQGFNGGNGRSAGCAGTTTKWCAGGGGGAGAIGGSAIANAAAGAGGVGRIVSWISTTTATAFSVGHQSGGAVYFAGGGGGGADHGGIAGAGGVGGGGAGSVGSIASGFDARAHTGGGGGGSGYHNLNGDAGGGDGGSGVVVIRYPLTSTTCSGTTSFAENSYIVVAIAAVQSNCTWTVPAGVSSIDYLVVAGGGGGGARHGGGGGAGGLLSANNVAVTSGQALSITVGAGGNGAAANESGMTSGGNSVLSDAGVTLAQATGGGAQATTGGSGGGAAASAARQTIGSGTTGQGFAGGQGADDNSCTGNSTQWCGGGGGGAGAVGQNADASNNNRAGNGGNGVATTLFTATAAQFMGVGHVSGGVVYFAGGGGGGVDSGGVAGTGGLGGGATGSANQLVAPSAAMANTGGGGGGGSYGTTQNSGGSAGGSGVVVIRYTPASSISLVDSAAVLNGTTQSFEVAQGTAFVSRAVYTVESWINPTTTTCASMCPIVSHDGDYTLVILNNQFTAFVYHSGTGNLVTWTTGVPARVNQWQHVALVRDGAALSLYVDGQLRKSSTLPSATRSTYAFAYPLWIGSNYAHLFSGRIDQFRLWSTARSAAAVASGMHEYQPSDTNGLVAHYDFNGVSGSTVTNRAPSPAAGSDLTAVGSPTYRDVKTTSYAAGDVVVTFPRSYLTSNGGWTVPDGVSNARAIVVAGGGGGGSAYDSVAGGGGGAGGLINRFTSGSVAFTTSTVRVTVGAGGAGGGPNGSGTLRSEWQVRGNNGQDSVLGVLTAVGGGAGGPRSGIGSAGGSGGGTGGRDSTHTGGAATSGQGNVGGKASVNFSHGAGGGGAGGAGGNASTTTIGAAGTGVTLTISGSSTTYASGGVGGNKDSSTTAGTAGSVNTGSGGSGGNGVTGANNSVVPGGFGGDGGSGVVVVRYTSDSAACSPTESRNGVYVVVTFDVVGDCQWNIPAGVTSVDYLLVGGGGGGGAYQSGSNGGGGGAGGVLDGTSLNVTPTQPVAISVGEGGAGGVRTTDDGGAHGTQGGNSALSGAGFTTITAIGGGYGAGAGPTSTPDDYHGGAGGSGGGALGSATTNGTGGLGVAGPPRQGFNGGNNLISCGAERPAGGGGGASAAGGNGVCANDQSGAGGAGRAVNITGSSVVYGGGGGGGGFGVANGSATPGAGGAGGGGAGGGIVGTAGVNGLGGGGGGAGFDTTVDVTVTGGDGGNGIAVLRYVDRILAVIEGDNQSGNRNGSAAVNPKVRAVDAAGNGIDGVTVSFTAASGSGSVGTSTVVTSGGGYASTTWTFGGDSSQSVDATMSGLTGTNTVTFSASVVISYSLSYDANGGTGAPVQATVNGGSTATVTATIPTRTGYSFASWNTAADGTGMAYVSGATFTMPDAAVELFAQWTLNSHSVIYDANNGSGAPSTATVTYGSTVTLSSTRPTRVGHTFAGWNTVVGGTGTAYTWDGSAFSPSTFAMPDENVTLFAQWSVNSYTVSYDANGGAGVPTSQSTNYNTSITVSATVPTRTGHTFAGWNTIADGSGISAASNSSFNVTDTVTLFAQWTINSRTVSYDANGGAGVPASLSANFGSTVTLSLTRPTRTGHTFAGWNTLADGTGTAYTWDGSAFSPSTFVMPDSAVTLFAQWTINSYNVSYDANGGAGAPTSQSANYNTSITVSATVPTRVGHTFMGWNTRADGSGSDYSSNTSITVTENVTLFAKWVVETFSISYDANGGSGAPVTASGIQFDTSVNLSATVPTRVGYTFASWNTASNGSGTTYVSNTSLVMPANNIALFAIWTATVQTITYDANGGSGAPSVDSVATDATATVSSSVPVRSGYTFLRWNTAADATGTDRASGVTFVMGATNITLHAVWLANTYSVIYDANGGMSPPAASSSQTDATFTVSASQPTRAGYTFVSWNTVRNGSGTHYAPSGTFTMPPNAVTVFAQWSANANNIVYNANGGSGAPANSVATTDSSTSISSTVPTRSGYSFTGWNTEANGSGTSYASGVSFTMPTTHLALFAQWTAATFQIVYDANGGSGAPASTNGTFLSTVSLSLVAPTNFGFTFLGWGTEANGSGTNFAAGGAFSVPAQNVTLYAVWVADVNDVYYVMNGGAGGPDAITAATNTSVNFATNIPTRTGYTFTGWNTLANGTGTNYAWNGSAFSPSSFTMPGSDIFFFAQWSINSYSITYDNNGGTGTTPTTQTGPYLSQVTVASATLTRSGWSFVGWNSAADGSGTQFAPGGSLTLGATHITLFAEWTRNVNAVIFDALGGTSAPDVRFGATGTSVTLPNSTPTREGYTFVSWEDSTQALHSPGATFTMPVSSVTLFARWSINSYQLTYELNGGTGTVPTAQSVEFSSSVTVSSASLSRSGFTFSRWNTQADGSGVAYNPSSTLVMPARAVTLYAQWNEVVVPTTTTVVPVVTTVVPTTVASATQKVVSRPSATATTVPTTPSTSSTTSTTSSTTSTTLPVSDVPVSEDSSSSSPWMWFFVGGLCVVALATFGMRRKTTRP